jgi:hypothetical protein
MISSTLFRAYGSTDITKAPILTILKSIGASTIYGSMTYLNDTGTNVAYHVFRITISGKTLTSSLLKRLQYANHKIVDIIADTGNKTYAIVTKYPDSSQNSVFLIANDWSRTSLD